MLRSPTYVFCNMWKQKTRSLLSGTFERCKRFSGKIFGRIISACVASGSSNGLLKQEHREQLQTAQVNILAGRDLQKQCPDSCLGKHCAALLTWLLDCSALWASTASVTWKEIFVFCPPAVISQLQWQRLKDVTSTWKNAHTELINMNINIDADVQIIRQVSSFVSILYCITKIPQVSVHIQIFRS